MMKCVKVMVLGWAIGVSAWANTRPVTPTDGSLQTILDGLVVSGSIDAVQDQISRGLFTPGPSGGSVLSLISSAMPSSDVWTIGLYDGVNPSSHAPVFMTTEGVGTYKFLSFMANGDIRVNFAKVASGFGEHFGFYASSTTDEVFSVDALNPASVASALIFQGDNATRMQLPGFSASVFSSNEFIVAFDLDGNANFSDFVFMAESIIPVPEPATLSLLTLCGAIAVRRWR